MSFGGGTDIDMIEYVAQHLKRADWKKVDVMVVTDGQWHASQDLSKKVAEAKKADTRFHGVQVGFSRGSELHTICSPVHYFNDWHAIG